MLVEFVDKACHEESKTTQTPPTKISSKDMTSSSTAGERNGFFPLAGGAQDGWSTEEEATATCFCGAVQLVFPTQGPGFFGTFICHCADCHKFTSSMFASNISVDDTYLKHARGRENLKQFTMVKSIASGNSVTSHFCRTCGSLMYRTSSGYPGLSVLRIGTVDDFSLHDTKLRPQAEHFTKTRVSWLTGVEGVKQAEASGI